jgi:hypothetical protein
VKPIGPVLLEVRNVASALRKELDPVIAGPLLVTGMLAEQLARDLARGASPGAVIAADASRLAGSSALVHVIAGEPSPADDELVRDADSRSIPIVLVQLWPQEDWTPPFVLTPYVVECGPGKGFPISEIASRIVEAVENPVAVARRIPVLQDSVAEYLVGTTAIRAAILGAIGAKSGAARPLITLEQLRMLAELRLLKNASARSDELKPLAALAAPVVGAGFLFRKAARSAQRALPAPVVNAAVAAAATMAVGEAFRRLDERFR